MAQKKPNPWKLYDVHGYLWEWCADSWSEDYEGAPTDGGARTDEKATHGVVRGGSWKDSAEKLTSSYRRKALRTEARVGQGDERVQRSPTRMRRERGEAPGAR